MSDLEVTHHHVRQPTTQVKKTGAAGSFMEKSRQKLMNEYVVKLKRQKKRHKKNNLIFYQRKYKRDRIGTTKSLTKTEVEITEKPTIQ